MLFDSIVTYLVSFFASHSASFNFCNRIDFLMILRLQLYGMRLRFFSRWDRLVACVEQCSLETLTMLFVILYIAA